MWRRWIPWSFQDAPFTAMVNKRGVTTVQSKPKKVFFFITHNKLRWGDGQSALGFNSTQVADTIAFSLIIGWRGCSLEICAPWCVWTGGRCGQISFRRRRTGKAWPQSETVGVGTAHQTGKTSNHSQAKYKQRAFPQYVSVGELWDDCSWYTFWYIQERNIYAFLSVQQLGFFGISDPTCAQIVPELHLQGPWV